MAKTITFGGLTASGFCPAQRVSDARADNGGVSEQHSVNSIRETGRATCQRCGRVVRVQRRLDDGRPGWSVWRYVEHRP